MDLWWTSGGPLALVSLRTCGNTKATEDHTDHARSQTLPDAPTRSHALPRPAIAIRWEADGRGGGGIVTQYAGLTDTTLNMFNIVYCVFIPTPLL